MEQYQWAQTNFTFFIDRSRLPRDCYLCFVKRGQLKLATDYIEGNFYQFIYSIACEVRAKLRWLLVSAPNVLVLSPSKYWLDYRSNLTIHYHFSLQQYSPLISVLGKKNLPTILVIVYQKNFEWEECFYILLTGCLILQMRKFNVKRC